MPKLPKKIRCPTTRVGISSTPEPRFNKLLFSKYLSLVKAPSHTHKKRNLLDAHFSSLKRYTSTLDTRIEDPGRLFIFN